MIPRRAWSAIALTVVIIAGCGMGGSIGDHPPVSGESCIGVPAPVCQRMIADARAAVVAGAGPVVGIQIACTTTCTVAGGEASVVTTHANGRTLVATQGWATPVGPAPGEPGGPPIVDPTPLPVEPECIGVPAAQCLEFAASVLGEPHTGTVVSVRVICDGGCTARGGRGSTEATFSDGTKRAEHWVYSSG